MTFTTGLGIGLGIASSAFGIITTTVAAARNGIMRPEGIMIPVRDIAENAPQEIAFAGSVAIQIVKGAAQKLWVCTPIATASAFCGILATDALHSPMAIVKIPAALFVGGQAGSIVSSLVLSVFGSGFLASGAAAYASVYAAKWTAKKIAM